MLKISSFSSPVHVSINTTAKCNLNCLHCSGDYGNTRCNEMDWDGWKKVVDYLIYSKVYTVNLTGGEPTQFPYLFDLLDSLKQNNIYVTLSSNLVFSKNILERLVSYKEIIRNIKTSIDGYNAETNGIIRQSNRNNENQLFERILFNYHKLKEAGFNITVTTVLHKRLIEDIDEMVGFIEEIHPNNWVVSPIVKVGRAQNNAHDIIPSFSSLMKPNYEKIKIKLQNQGVNFSQVDFPSKENLDPYGCPACNESVIINYDGQIAPCQLSLEILPQYGYIFPNVLSTQYDQIWACEAFEKFRYAQHHGCKDCAMKTECKRCVPQSLKYFGDAGAPTPYCISVAEQVGLKNKSFWEDKLRTI